MNTIPGLSRNLTSFICFRFSLGKNDWKPGFIIGYLEDADLELKNSDDDNEESESEKR